MFQKTKQEQGKINKTTYVVVYYLDENMSDVSFETVEAVKQSYTTGTHNVSQAEVDRLRFTDQLVVHVVLILFFSKSKSYSNFHPILRHSCDYSISFSG